MSNTSIDVALVDRMWNIKSRTSGKAYRDDAKQLFKTGTANKLIVPECHNGWTLPKY